MSQHNLLIKRKSSWLHFGFLLVHYFVGQLQIKQKGRLALSFQIFSTTGFWPLSQDRSVLVLKLIYKYNPQSFIYFILILFDWCFMAGISHLDKGASIQDPAEAHNYPQVVARPCHLPLKRTSA